MVVVSLDSHQINVPPSVESVAGAVLGFYLYVRNKSNNWKISTGYRTLESPVDVVNFLSPHILLTDASYKPLNLIAGSELVLPVRNQKGTYTHFMFKSMDFIDSFILALDEFQVDFRDYIYGVPYQIKEGRVVYHRIPGYDIQVPKWGHPMLPQPFSSVIPEGETLYTY